MGKNRLYTLIMSKEKYPEGETLQEYHLCEAEQKRDEKEKKFVCD